MNLISIYLHRIGCLISVALVMVIVTVLVKVTTRWFGMDSASSQKVADTASEWVGKGLFGLAMFVGLCPYAKNPTSSSPTHYGFRQVRPVNYSLNISKKPLAILL